MLWNAHLFDGPHGRDAPARTRNRAFGLIDVVHVDGLLGQNARRPLKGAFGAMDEIVRSRGRLATTSVLLLEVEQDLPCRGQLLVCGMGDGAGREFEVLQRPHLSPAVRIWGGVDLEAGHSASA